MHIVLLTSPIIGAGLRTLLQERWPESHVLYEGSRDPNRIASVLIQQPNVTLLDGDHLQVISFLADLDRQRVKELGNIVILTTHPTEAELFGTLRWGAQAYLNAMLAPHQLIEAINAVSQGSFLFNSDILSDPVLLRRQQRKPVSQEVPEKLVAEKQRKTPSQNISERKPAAPSPQKPLPNGIQELEQKMLLLVAKGQTNKQIAACLRLSEDGVKQRFTHIFSTLEVSGRTEAVVRALRAGWISVDAMPNKKEAAS
jgi:two-component system, NarL family, response regulator DegU